MMSCTTSAMWTHHVLSLCRTEHGSYRGAILSGRITSVVMSRSGQLGRRCTIEPQYSCVPWKHASLATCLGQLSLSLFMWSTTRRGS
jgi:hypothetical protein